MKKYAFCYQISSPNNIHIIECTHVPEQSLPTVFKNHNLVFLYASSDKILKNVTHVSTTCYSIAENMEVPFDDTEHTAVDCIEI